MIAVYPSMADAEIHRLWCAMAVDCGLRVVSVTDEALTVEGNDDAINVFSANLDYGSDELFWAA